MFSGTITEARFPLHLFELCASFKSFCGTYFYFLPASVAALQKKMVHKLRKGVSEDSAQVL